MDVLRHHEKCPHAETELYKYSWVPHKTTKDYQYSSVSKVSNNYDTLRWVQRFSYGTYQEKSFLWILLVRMYRKNKKMTEDILLDVIFPQKVHRKN